MYLLSFNHLYPRNGPGYPQFLFHILMYLVPRYQIYQLSLLQNWSEK